MPLLIRRRGAFVGAFLLFFLPFFVPEAAAQTGSPTLVISQIYGEAGCNAPSCSRFNHDFIELFNRSRNPVTISGWSVQYASATGSEWEVTPLPTLTIQSGKYVLIQGAGNAFGQQPLPQSDAVGTFDIALSAGKVALVSNASPLTGSCPRLSEAVIDFLGFGASANCFEGNGPAPAPTSQSPALRRRSAGIRDHDDNLSDFLTTVPLPRNSATARMFLPGDLLITELRDGGPKGSTDDFVEIYNNTDFTFTQGTGSNILLHLLDAHDGCLTVATRVADGTIIPPRGHYLFAGADYSLASYAGKNGNTPHTDDQKFAYAVKFNNILMDSVSFNGAVTCNQDPEFFSVEGTPLFSVGGANVQYSHVRKMAAGLPQDTQNNASDFDIVSVTGANIQGIKQTILGAPGPENLSSPVQHNATVKASLIDPSVAATAPPNRVRSGRGGLPGSFGTLSIQRRFKNATGAPLTRLRFRVVDITTLSSPVTSSPQADLRVISSTGVVTNSQGVVVAEVTGLTLEEPPLQTSGGGLNSTLTVVLPGGSLAAGNTIDVQFLLSVQREGAFRFLINVEALTGPVDTFGATKVRDTKASRAGKKQ